MNGTIYDFAGLPRVAPHPIEADQRRPRSASGPIAVPRLVGVVSNPRSHRNRGGAAVLDRPGVLHAVPRTRAELPDVLSDFARQGIDLLVIDGGDGTIRDVLTCGGAVWGDRWPAVAVLPAGKTNALAADLGVPRDWTVDDALAAAAHGRTAARAPITIERRGEAGIVVRGFLFGAGAFVEATALAQHTHRLGAFNGVAVALALVWGLAETFFGGTTGRWRRGSRMAVRFDPQAQAMHGAALDSDGQRFIMLSTTFDQLPVGLRIFGHARSGLKTLLVDAPARRLARVVLPLLRGSEDPGFEALGYHRVDASAIEVEVEKGFILDGELFPGGGYTLRRGAPIRFVTP